jgi:large subunit ribosomal protein L15
VKLHDLKPAPGSRKERTRVGRGIAAGKGKTAGRGTKGQKARAGGSIPAWFEGGQTPLQMRVPKLRGFKPRDRVEYQVVNVGRISAYAAAGRFGVELESGGSRDAGGDPVTVNVEVLRRAGLVSSERKPVKVLGSGDVTEKLFVATDAVTRSARQKIEAAGGFVQLLAPEKKAATDAELQTDAEPRTDAEPQTDAKPEIDPEGDTTTAPEGRAGATDAEPADL